MGESDLRCLGMRVQMIPCTYCTPTDSINHTWRLIICSKVISDTSILHHVFLLLFIMFLFIIMFFGVIIMPFQLICSCAE